MLLQNCKNGRKVFQYGVQLISAFPQLYSAILFGNQNLQEEGRVLHISRQNKKATTTIM